MSAETSISYPFPICKDCIAAKIVVSQQRSKSPMFKSGKTEAIQLTCYVDNQKPTRDVCYIGGTRIDSYATEPTGLSKGKREIIANQIGISTNGVPDFCPQLTKK